MTVPEEEPQRPDDWLGADTPDVGIAGIHLFRSVIQPADPDPGEELSWSIVGRLHLDKKWTHLWGDLYILQDGWELGVTVSALIQYRNEELPFDPHDVGAGEAHIHALAPWTSHAMYDVASQWARQLVAASYPAPDFDIPVRTPKLTDVGVVPSGRDDDEPVSPGGV